MQLQRRFLEFCRPIPFPTLWNGYRPESVLFNLPVYRTAALARMEEQFLEHELIASGLVRELPDGLTWHPALSTQQGVVFVKAQSADDAVRIETSANVTSDGLLIPGTVFEGGAARTVPLEAETFLLVAFDIETFHLLQHLEMPAITLHGLSEEIIQRFLQRSAACGPPESGATAHETSGMPPLLPEVADSGPSAVLETTSEASTIVAPLTFIFVGWSPAALSLERPSKLAPLADWLLQAEQCLDWELSHLSVWFPSEVDLQRLTFCLQAGDSRAVRRVLSESIASSQFTLEAAACEQAASAPSYVEALRRYRRIVENPACSTDLERELARAELHRAIDDELIEPLLERAAGERAIPKNLLALAAGVGRTLHRMLIDEGGFDWPSIQRHERRPRGGSSSEPIIRMANQFRALCSEIRR